MKNNIDWLVPRNNFSFHREVLLHYVLRLMDCVRGYKNGKTDAGTTLKTCKKILNKIDDPEFPFFAVKNFGGLFSFILYELTKVSPQHRIRTLQPEIQYKINRRGLLMLEKRKFKRLKKPFIIRFRTIPIVAQRMLPPDWDMVVAKDLSAGGVLFNSKENLDIDSLINIKIDISKFTPTINCVGKIIRSDGTQPSSMFRIATEFTMIDEQEKEMINKTVETS